MDKIIIENSESANLIQENIDLLKELFPEAFTEDGVDFDVLRQLLGDASVLEVGEEKYGLNWHGKKKARQIALTPSAGTLLPCPEDSVSWDTTRNLFIEGDNLEVLKLFQKSYGGQVKMIYIDPPYNTGNEFIYPDKFQENLETYLKYTNQIDNEGLKISSNTESSGKKHTVWMNMMYPRLSLAKNLLKRNGVIFISIGQDEFHTLRALCDDVFGAENFVTTCSRVIKTGGQKGAYFSPCVDYILCYAKSIQDLAPFREEISQNVIDKVYTKTQKDGDRAGEKYRPMGLYQAMLDKRANQRFYIECPDGTLCIPPGDTFPAEEVEGEQVTPGDGDGVWRWTYSRYQEAKNQDGIDFLKSNKTSLVRPGGSPSDWNVYYKIWLKDRLQDGQLPGNIITKFESRHASAEMKKLDIPFDFPKPSALIKYLMVIAGVKPHEIVLDFFAGSCPLGHAAMELSCDRNAPQPFICIQLPEPTGEKSAEYKAGYKTIAEIGKKRLKNAAEFIVGNAGGRPEKADLGFKVFKLAQSNIRAWSPDRTDLDETLLNHKEHLIGGRSEQDLLYELLLKRGVDLSEPIKEREVSGKTLYSIGSGVLFVCLNPSITRDQVEEIAHDMLAWHKELEPETDTHVFFRDSAFNDDNVAKTNMAAILEQNGITHVRSL